MSFNEYILTLINLGPVKIAYDSALLLFLLIRFVPFVRNFSDDLPRNIYLSTLFSAAYASSVGFFVDMLIGEFDSEFRIIFGIIGAYFITETSVSLWHRFCESDPGLISQHIPTPNSLRSISISWLSLSLLFGFVIFEWLLGRPMIYKLHTEQFAIMGNVYLGFGRIISRSYIIAAVLICCYILWCLIKTSFRNQPRLRLRTWAALFSLAFVGVHYLQTMIGTVLVILEPEWEQDIKRLYDQAALGIAIASAISIGLLASPRTVLELVLHQKDYFVSYLYKGRIEWLHQYLVDAMKLSGERQHFPSTTLALSKESGKLHVGHVVISISDIRRFILCYLTDENVSEILKRLPKLRRKYRRYDTPILTEALLLHFVVQKIKNGDVMPNNELSSRLVKEQANSISELISHYAAVGFVLQGLTSERGSRILDIGDEITRK